MTLMTAKLKEGEQMLVGYVSDERYMAVPDCALLFEQGSTVVPARSAANGAVYAELPSGTYNVALSNPGYGAKRVWMEVNPDRPYHFRLLTDCLLGYAWPKCVRSGERSDSGGGASPDPIEGRAACHLVAAEWRCSDGGA